MAAKRQFYGLGLLMALKNDEAATQIRGLLDSYEDVQLRSAAMRALAALGQNEDLDMLRNKASSVKGTYGGVDDLVGEMQERLAALRALGSGKDAAFLPWLLDVLQEAAPQPGAIAEAGDDHDKLAAWYILTLRSGACDCLQGICRERQFFELTADR